MRRIGNRLLLAALFLTLASATVEGAGIKADRVAGPIEADVLEVLDGDTVRVRAHTWLNAYQVVDVRLSGVDAPEMEGPCEEERLLANRARTALAGRIANGRVLLRDIGFDAYAGRVVARLFSSAGEDVAALLIADGLGRAYDGGRRKPWCVASAR